jgi:hypothetical protein
MYFIVVSALMDAGDVQGRQMLNQAITRPRIEDSDIDEGHG